MEDPFAAFRDVFAAEYLQEPRVHHIGVVSHHVDVIYAQVDRVLEQFHANSPGILDERDRFRRHTHPRLATNFRSHLPRLSDRGRNVFYRDSEVIDDATLARQCLAIGGHRHDQPVAVFERRARAAFDYIGTKQLVMPCGGLSGIRDTHMHMRENALGQNCARKHNRAESKNDDPSRKPSGVHV